MAAADRAVLDAIEEDVLQPEVVARSIEKALALLAESPRRGVERHQALLERLATLTAEVERFTAAIAAGAGDLTSVVKALREREDERARVEAELSALLGAVDVAAVDTPRLRRTIAVMLNDWRGLLTRQVAQGREALQTLLDGRITFTAEPAAGRYVFEGRVVVGRLIRGSIEAGALRAVVAPTGFEPVFTVRHALSQ